MNKALPFLLLAGLCASTGALAATTGSVTATSDYSFRGLDMTAGPAIQGNVRWTAYNGLFVEGFASNAVKGSELTATAGWGTHFNRSGYVEAGLKYHAFLEDKQAFGYNVDYPEIYVGASYMGLTAKLAYADSYFNTDGEALYASLDYGYGLGKNYQVKAHAGYSDGKGVAPVTAVGTLLSSLGSAVSSDDNYVDYSLGVTRALGNNMSATLTLVNTTLDGDDPKAIVSVSKAF